MIQKIIQQIEVTKPIKENQIIKRVNGEQVRVSKGKGLSLAHVYLYYLSIIKTNKFNIKYSEFKSIVSDFNEMLGEHIVEGKTVKLPFGMGYFFIKKTKMNYEQGHKLKLNHYLTQKLNKKVYFLNEHSSEWKARFFWSKKNIKSSVKNYYSFQPIKPLKLKLSAEMKKPDGWKKYTE